MGNSGIRLFYGASFCRQNYERAARQCLDWRDRQVRAGRDLRLLADDCLHKDHYDYLEPISPDIA